jgi:enhancer of polycomb-like protein
MCLQLDESNDTDPFVCFRRRDAKAVRKTRRADNTPADKITRLRIELQQVSDLAASVVTREMKKAELGKDSQNVLEARLRLFDHKRRFPHLSSPQDDQMLIEQERPPTKRIRMNEREPVGSGYGLLCLMTTLSH